MSDDWLEDWLLRAVLAIVVIAPLVAVLEYLFKLSGYKTSLWDWVLLTVARLSGS